MNRSVFMRGLVERIERCLDESFIDLPFTDIAQEVEIYMIEYALGQCDGNKTRAASMLNLLRTCLVGKCQKYLPHVLKKVHRDVFCPRRPYQSK